MVLYIATMNILMLASLLFWISCINLEWKSWQEDILQSSSGQNNLHKLSRRALALCTTFYCIHLLFYIFFILFRGIAMVILSHIHTILRVTLDFLASSKHLMFFLWEHATEALPVLQTLQAGKMRHIEDKEVQQIFLCI